MTTAVRQVELLAKQRPRQARAKRTYDAILTSASELLVEVGIERISTNLIAERAGVTVPALYRYFPNKYAVIHALGTRLMQKQNAAFATWLTGFLERENASEVLYHGHVVLRLIYDVIRNEPAGIEIFNALRAMAPLRELRLVSRREAADGLANFMSEVARVPRDETLTMHSRMTVDLACGVVEMAIEDNQLDPDVVMREGARMLQEYWRPYIRL
ncbi:TetR/AcrR family transcriptional regulator [Mangrovimicrobium sediminis]|uniref:TetR/AcrR family transcriptional regulator n=1 Tax=Mangrovimicrobium sediminis TaxID=2562682 RepID=A0A4Z0LXB6_9GAMM|nr:TetR/AcrR family transcriptional regulator [Haliea sp. SAOS-164]TGD71929.1 TetR/AcrR family transcriptional regulator [Haliea sp. SAOS-164]